MDFTLEFLRIFATAACLIAPILASLSVMVIGLGQIVGKIERWKKSDTLYWSLITATTVGYGDIRPTKGSSRMLSICIAILGVIFTGILVSIAIEATSHTFRLFADPAAVEAIKEKLEQQAGRG